MKVLVCGSRSWIYQGVMYRRLRQLPPGSTIISGGARGADELAEWLAPALGFTSKVYPADWETFGKRAGYIRNVQMLEQDPDLVIAFWDGESRGTAHTIREAEKRGIPVEVIRGGTPEAEEETR